MTTIEVGSIWYNDYQKVEVEITCVKDDYVCYNFNKLAASGFSPIEKFLNDYILISKGEQV